MGIEGDIHDLLYSNDCVIIPGFGGLITNHRSARLDESRRQVHPPAKDLSFNRRLTRNDGLLADRLASRLGLSHEDALVRVEREAKAWTAHLDRDGRLELAGIGTFFHDAQKNLLFEPDRHTNYLKDAYGLRPVAAVPIARVLPVREAIIRQLPKESAANANKGRQIPVLWAAAIVTGLLFAAGAFWTYDRMDGLQLGSFDLFTSEPSTYHPRTEQPEPLADADETEWQAPDTAYGVQTLPIAGSDGPLVHVDLGPAPPAPSVVAEPDKTVVAVGDPQRTRYHVIGGCFSIKENADRFGSELRGQGFEAVLVDQHRGLYRVAFGSYPDRTMAIDALSAVRRREGQDAWLLVK